MSVENSKIKKEFIIGILLAFIVLGVLISMYSLNKVHRTLTVEAGAKVPEISQFMKNTDNFGSFVTDISTIDTSMIGVHRVEIQIGEKVYNSKLKIEDTIAPIGEVIKREIPIGEEIEAKDFITNIVDATKVIMYYKEEPDFTKIGGQAISIVLEDEASNKVELNTELYIGKVHRLIKVEIGTPQLDIYKFLMNSKFEGTFVTDTSKIDLNKLGLNEVTLKVDDEEYISQVEIIDTIAPTADTIDGETWVNEEIEAKELVENIEDKTNVNVYFKEQPDFSKVGVQKVSIILEDESKNITELKANLSVKEDTEPPKIFGVQNQTFYLGERISYKRGVTVTDNKDEDIELMVDSSTVNLKVKGSYEVIYSATDSSGNSTTKTVTLEVKDKLKANVDPEELNKLADNILSNIITDEMTDKEKLWEIYTWTKSHITYTGSSDKSDWRQGAIQGIKLGSGDCFNYYATARILLTRAGFENLLIQRDGGDSQHFWNLVYYEGGWYHFDTNPSYRKYPYVAFLRTDAEVEEYSKECKDYYKFDKTKYPATPLEPLDLQL